uniref:Protein-tyrosine-phosphatase n=1 Tax=Mesocestoides corti TaxID=53468 RepID=A0A5K3FAP1_MESCO
APSAPTDVTAKAVSSNSIVVSWSPPTETNGILKPYRAHCTQVGDNWPYSASTKDNTTTSVEVKGLRSNTKYECYVEASTTALLAQWPDTLTTKSAKSTPVTTWPGTLQSLLIKDLVALDAHSLEVSWGDPENVGGTLGGFTVSIRPYVQGSVSRPEWQHVANVSAESRSHKISGLEPNTRYEVTVRGYVLPNDEGQGGGYNDYAFARSGVTWSAAPSVPTNVRLKADSSEQATISWQAPAEPNGDIANYTVFMATKETNLWETNATVSAKTFAYSFVGLKPYTRIFAAVRAATAPNERGKGGGIGPLSATEEVTTDETAPGPVSDLTCVQEPAGSSRLVCRWQEPVDKNGLIRSYKLQLVDKHDADRVVFEGTSASPEATIEQNLNFDHTFSLSVSAVTIEEGPALSIGVNLIVTKFPAAAVEPVTQHLLSPPPSSLPVSDNSTECHIYLKLSAIDFTQYSPVSRVGVFVEESASASARTSDGMPYYAYAQGISKSWEVTAISRSSGVSQNMEDYIFTLGADKGTIQPDNSFNGPLKPSTDYVVKIRFHNKAGFTETSGVSIRTSSKVDENSLPGDANANARLSSGAIAGIVIACLVAVAVVVAAVVLKVRRAQKRFIVDADAYHNAIVNEL